MSSKKSKKADPLPQIVVEHKPPQQHHPNQDLSEGNQSQDEYLAYSKLSGPQESQRSSSRRSSGPMLMMF